MMPDSRVSIVNHVRLDAALFASILHIGDSEFCHPKCRAFSMQRGLPIFRDDEAAYFNQTWKPLPAVPVPAKQIIKQTTSLAPIFVNKLKITSVSGSGVVHIGSTHDVKLEAELKHIRNFL